MHSVKNVITEQTMNAQEFAKLTHRYFCARIATAANVFRGLTLFSWGWNQESPAQKNHVLNVGRTCR